MSASNPQQLIQDYLEGCLSKEDADDLTNKLKTDADLLKQFTEELMFENELRQSIEVEFNPVSTFIPSEPKINHRRVKADAPSLPTRIKWVQIAAVAVFFVCLFIAFSIIQSYSHSSRHIVTLESVSGVLSWTGASGEQVHPINPQQALAAGTFETLGENAHAVLRFDDGTSISLGGQSRIIITQLTQKLINLQKGSMRAIVMPQPIGGPMIVRTSTANIEVLGTTFSVSAATDRTTLNVEEGTVKMKRLADGDTTEVSANHSVAASLETQTPLHVVENKTLPAKWLWQSGMPLPTGSRGLFKTAGPGRPELLAAVPIVVGTEPEDGRVLVQHGVVFNDEDSTNHGAFAALTPDSVIRFRYHAAQQKELVVFFVTHLRDGGFGGNFEFKLPTGSGELINAEGWREVTLRLQDAPPLHPAISRHPGDNNIVSLSIRSFRQEARLEFSRVAITPR